MAQTLELFPRERTPSRKLMHVTDAGNANGKWLRFTCSHCGHTEDGCYDLTLTEAKRGIPCPKCAGGRETP